MKPKEEKVEEKQEVKENNNGEECDENKENEEQSQLLVCYEYLVNLKMNPIDYSVTPIFPRTNPEDPIYLDYNATTPIDPEVAKAMWPYMTQYFGNPSSNHVYGKRKL